MQEAVLSQECRRANRCNKRAGAAMSYKKCVKNRPDTLVCAMDSSGAKTSFPSMSHQLSSPRSSLSITSWQRCFSRSVCAGPQEERCSTP